MPTLDSLEKKAGVVIRDADPKQNITEEKFEELKTENGYVFIDFKSRTKFLKDNGYELTRENLINPDLGTKK